MKKYLFFGFLTLAIILSFNSQAQEKGPSFHRGLFFQSKECTPLSELEKTDEQHTAIAEKKRYYREQTMADKVLLLAKRLEFERMLKDPEAKKDDLHDIVEEIGQLTGRLEAHQLNLLIDVHQLLTPPQIEEWCTSSGKTFEKGKSRRPY